MMISNRAHKPLIRPLQAVERQSKDTNASRPQDLSSYTDHTLMLSSPIPAPAALSAQAPAQESQERQVTSGATVRGRNEAANEPLDVSIRAIFNPRLAERFLIDQRFNSLSAKSLGIYVMLRAQTDCGHPVPANLGDASKMLRSSRSVCESAIRELMATRPALVLQRDGLLIPTPFGATIRTGESIPANSAARTRQGIDGLDGVGESGRASKRAGTPRSKLEQVKKVLRPAKPKAGVTLAALPRAEILPQDLMPSATPDFLGVSPTPIHTTGDLFGEEAPRPAPARVLDCPYAEIGALFGNLCSDLKKIGPVQTWPQARKRKLLERWKRCPDLGFWKSFFERVRDSDWLMGRSGKNWIASFDWVIGPQNFEKIVEGNYVNSGTTRRSLFNQGPPLPAAAYGSHEIPDDAPWMTGSSEGQA